MANIFRVVKDKNYTIVNNEYLKNKNLRVDSIGLLTVILSLPSDFNITMKGLISLTHQKANYRAIKVMLDNLKENGYLEISSIRDEDKYGGFRAGIQIEIDNIKEKSFKIDNCSIHILDLSKMQFDVENYRKFLD